MSRESNDNRDNHFANRCTMNRCCRLCVGSLEQPYCLVKQGARKAADEALFQLAAYNCSAEVSDNGAPCLCKACYNLVMRIKNSYGDLERQRASLREQLAKPDVFFWFEAQKGGTQSKIADTNSNEFPCSQV